jgi:hypothetical protein
VDFSCLDRLIYNVFSSDKKKHFTKLLTIDIILSCVKLFGGAYLKWQ